MANAIVGGKQEDQPKPLAVRAAEDQLFNFSPRGKHSDSVSSACSCQGLAEPCPLCGLLCVPGGCTVRACSPGHDILHITFVFCSLPHALRECVPHAV